MCKMLFCRLFKFYAPLLVLSLIIMVHVVSGMRIEVFGKEDFQDLLYESEGIEDTCYTPEGLKGFKNQSLKSVKTDSCLIIFMSSSCKGFNSMILPPGEANLTQLDIDANWPRNPHFRYFNSYKFCSKGQQRVNKTNVDIYRFDTSGSFALKLLSFPDSHQKLVTLQDLTSCQNLPSSYFIRYVSIDNHHRPIKIYSGLNCTEHTKFIPGGHNYKSFYGHDFCRNSIKCKYGCSNVWRRKED